MRSIYRFILFVLSLSVATTISAQDQMKGWEFGPWAGVSYYFGDLNTNYRLDRPNLAGGFAARYNFNPRLAFRLCANYGSIEAYDSDSQNPFEVARNLSFESTIWDGSAMFEFNFLPYIHGSRDYFFTPYLFAGFSVFSFNPKAEYTGDLPEYQGQFVELRPLGTEGQFKGEEYYSVTGAINYGFGFKFDINYDWSIDIQLGVRNTYTDYLDDVSTVYPDRSDLLRDRGQLAVDMSDRSIDVDGVETSILGQKGQQRGDADERDVYIFAGVGVLYYFGDVRCPEYSRRR